MSLAFLLFVYENSKNHKTVPSLLPHTGAVLALARWEANGGAQFQLEGPGATICS